MKLCDARKAMTTIAFKIVKHFSSRIGGWFRLACSICCMLGFAATNRAATTENAKCVLIVHSFGSAAPPFSTHSIAFETELSERLGKNVDLDEVSLDHARFSDPEMEEALV